MLLPPFSTSFAFFLLIFFLFVFFRFVLVYVLRLPSDPFPVVFFSPLILLLRIQLLRIYADLERATAGGRPADALAARAAFLRATLGNAAQAASAAAAASLAAGEDAFKVTDTPSKRTLYFLKENIGC